MPRKDLNLDAFSTTAVHKKAEFAYDKAKKSPISSQQATRDRIAKTIPNQAWGKPKESPRQDFTSEWNRYQQQDKSIVDGSARARQTAIAKKLKK